MNGLTTGKTPQHFLKNLRCNEEIWPPDTIIVGLGPVPTRGRVSRFRPRSDYKFLGARLIGYPSICAMECDAEEYYAIGDARRKSFFFARIPRIN